MRDVLYMLVVNIVLLSWISRLTGLIGSTASYNFWSHCVRLKWWVHSGSWLFLALTSYFHGRKLDTIKDAEIVWTITSPCLSNVLCYALPECVIRGSASVHRFFFSRCTASRSACCRFIHTGIKQGCLLYYSSVCLVLCMDMHYNSCF